MIMNDDNDSKRYEVIMKYKCEIHDHKKKIQDNKRDICIKTQEIEELKTSIEFETELVQHLEKSIKDHPVKVNIFPPYYIVKDETITRVGFMEYMDFHGLNTDGSKK